MYHKIEPFLIGMKSEIYSAIAAYNAGFVVSDWLNDTNYSSDGKNLDSIPYPETKNYVDKVESAKEMYIKLYYSQSN